jgi:putative flippase GtrA
VLNQIRSSKVYVRLTRHEALGQFARYAIVGVLNVGVHLLIFNVLLLTGLHTLGANAIAFCFATVNSFFLNKVWAFRDARRDAIFKQYLVFFFFTLVGLGLHTSLFALLLIPLRPHGAIGKNVALVSALPVSVIWNFTCYKLWTFRPHQAAA